MAEIVVAGAGRSGLLAGRMLAERGLRVTMVERLPAPGGQEPEPQAPEWALAAEQAGVRWLLGTLAVRYADGVLHTLGTQGFRRLTAELLVVATGTRPATRAELGITGDRGAGVLPGSVAHHFLDSGVLPGYRPLVIGEGELADELCSQLLAAGARSVTRVFERADRTVSIDARVETFADSRVVSVHGFPRVVAAELQCGDQLVRVDADAVLLAEGRVPMRNIEGAIGARPGVVECFSSADPKTHQDAVATATRACQASLVLASHDKR